MSATHSTRLSFARSVVCVDEWESFFRLVRIRLTNRIKTKASLKGRLLLLFDFLNAGCEHLRNESVERSFSLIRCPNETINGGEILERATVFYAFV